MYTKICIPAEARSGTTQAKASLSLRTPSCKDAGYAGVRCLDPTGVVQTVYPLPFVFSKDLGEQPTIAGVLAGHCASRTVPPSQFDDLKAARVDPTAKIRTLAKMKDVRKAMEGLGKGEAATLAKANGLSDQPVSQSGLPSS
jgi:hypothetical protein